MLDIDVALKAKGLSQRSAGAKVRETWQSRERGAKPPSAAAIGAKIGLLAKGDRTWFRNHRQALHALADVLGCSPADLLPPEEAGPGLIEFAEFSELAPLLPGQDPCAVNVDGWLGSLVDARLHQGGHWWFTAGPGVGKSLVIRFLQQRRGSEVAATTARTLAQGIRGAGSNPLVIEVEHKATSTDPAALSELTKHHSSVCVLASFGRPESLAGWSDQHWKLEPGWDERLIAWVQTRLPPERRVDPTDIVDWLNVIDPQRRLFASPGDLMPLIARVVRAGLPNRKEGLSGFERAWLGQTCATATEPWLRHVGPELIDQLVSLRLRRVDLPAAPLSVAQWAGMAPTGVFASKPAASRPTKTKKVLATSETSELPSMLPIEVVHALADQGLLRTFENGGLDTFPRWVRAAIERDTIIEAVRKHDAQWPLWAVEDTRRDLVDDALDALSPSDLITAVKRVGENEHDLADVAAVEALFAAAGRRMLDAEWRPTPDMIPTLQQLGLRQLRLLDSGATVGSNAAYVPLTRYRSNDRDAWYSTWLAEAWTFSINVPAPRAAVSAGWQMPGWASDLRLADAPSLPFPANDSPRMLRLLRAARRVVQLTRDAEVPDDVDLLLVPWTIIDGAPHGWTHTAEHEKRVLGSAVLPIVGELLKGEPDEVCARAVAIVWAPLLARYGDPFNMLNQLREFGGLFFNALVDHLPLNLFEDAIAAMAERPFEPSIATLVALPARLRRSALRAVARLTIATKRPVWQLDRVVAALDRDDIDLLVEFAAERYDAGRAATARVWELDPERALAEALDSLTKSSDAASAWFFSAPSAYVATLLDAIKDVKPRPAWTRRWLATTLSRAGVEAPRVFVLMQGG